MKYLNFLFILAVATSTLAFLSSCQNATANEKVQIEKGSDQVNWITINELSEAQKGSSKKVIVDVYTDWCKWCKVMDQKTFSDNELSKYLNANFHMVKLNAEEKAAIDFKGEKFSYVKNGRRGYNELAYKLCKGSLSYPSFVVLDESLEIVKVMPGFKDAKQFKAQLEQSI